MDCKEWDTHAVRERMRELKVKIKVALGREKFEDELKVR